MTKLNKESYCHDCGTKIERENFYCEKCINENGLNKFNILAFILSLLQPLFALIICTVYKKQLNPGICRSCLYGVVFYGIIIVCTFIFGFIFGILGLA